jgi:hypothetical protein
MRAAIVCAQRAFRANICLRGDPAPTYGLGESSTQDLSAGAADQFKAEFPVENVKLLRS